MKAYHDEELSALDVGFADNQAILDMFYSLRPQGIFVALDEITRLDAGA
jgi:myosin heavy subunit